MIDVTFLYSLYLGTKKTDGLLKLPFPNSGSLQNSRCKRDQNNN